MLRKTLVIVAGLRLSSQKKTGFGELLPMTKNSLSLVRRSYAKCSLHLQPMVVQYKRVSLSLTSRQLMKLKTRDKCSFIHSVVENNPLFSSISVPFRTLFRVQRGQLNCNVIRLVQGLNWNCAQKHFHLIL